MSGNIPRQGGVPVIFCTIPDSRSLAALYMPVLKGGGLFIPGETGHALGDEVFLVICLPGQAGRHSVMAKVAWIAPAGKRATRSPGTGLRFTGNDNGIRTTLEHLISNTVSQDRQVAPAW